MYNNIPESKSATDIQMIKFYAAVAIDLFLLIFVLVGDCLGFKSIHKVSEFQRYECMFFSIRLIGELAKIFITVMYCWLNKNIFFEDLVHKDENSRFGVELKYYVTVNAVITFILFFWGLTLLRRARRTRENLATEVLKAQYEDQDYFGAMNLKSNNNEMLNEIGDKE